MSEQPPSLRAAYAKSVLHRHLEQKYNAVNGLDGHQRLPPKHIDKFPADGPSPRPPSDTPICIVGAGAAGLAVAIFLQQCGFTNIDIYEATANRGGRCYSYTFQNGPDCPHDYYDVGAMRIPQIQTMQSTFNMIDWLIKPEQGQTVTKTSYTYKAGEEPTMYYYSSSSPDNSKFDNFMQNLLISKDFLDQKGQPTKDFDTAFWNYINSSDAPDNYSTRSFLLAHGWTFEDIQTAETLDTSTGIFDQAFMETICDWYDFHLAASQPWYRIEGGMAKLTDAMYNVAIKRGVNISWNSPVTAMQDNGETVGVTYIDQTGQNSKNYSVVFNTTTFGCLQHMDLQGLQLSKDTLVGIRALSYDRATKIAIKFTNPWWSNLLLNLKAGGVSSSDLPISNVVYPSWDDGDKAAHTIIVSYSWAQDATRMASLVSSNGQERTDGECDPVIELCFANLVKLWWSITEPKGIDLMQLLRKSYIAHHAFSWAHDRYTAGGFALFGPQQFSNMYKQFTQPLCQNKLLICGEAISAHHAWISGALDSAYQAVAAWTEGKQDLKSLNILKESPLGGGIGKHPAEVSETLLYWNVKLAGEEVKSN
ncbi:MAG: hypothetical protein M1821_009934 [Bathelium mastoideum]|nr:MAG: hypothetical protein M1821_009934 [Bathelium mastoideum]